MSGMQMMGRGIPLKRRELEALYIACSVAMQEPNLTAKTRADFEALHKRLLNYLENSQATEYAITPTYG